MSKVDIVLGAQLGDEGKGRLIDILAVDYDIIARCNSGGNAGHKVVVDNYTYAFHMVPSGILNPNTIGIIGNGCVVNLEDLKEEIQTIQSVIPNNQATQTILSRLFISDRCHIVLSLHKEADTIRENMKTTSSSIKNTNQSIGTTRQGMGPVYATKALRVGLRMCDLFLSKTDLSVKVKLLIDELSLVPSIQIPPIETILNTLMNHSEFYKPLIRDTITYLNKAREQNKRILVEGAQATLLDNDFGVYPYCTATTCTIGAISTGLGIAPHHVGTVNYVLKTYTTRVGNGPFPTEQLNTIGEKLQTLGHEYGTTTGRRRRCGWLDIPMVKWSIMINGTSPACLCITKLDVLDTFPEIKLATKYFLPTDEKNDLLIEQNGFPASLETLANVHVHYETFEGWMTSTTNIRSYEDLPWQAKSYLSRIEELLGVPIQWIGVGPDREAMIMKP